MSILDLVRPRAAPAIKIGERAKGAKPARVGRWGPGTSGNPDGRPYTPREVVDACRAQSLSALGVLWEIIARWRAGDSDITATEAQRASTALLDRGYGTAPQVVRVEGTDTDDTLALDPDTLDGEALRAYATLLKHLGSSQPAPKLVEGTAARRAPAAVANRDSSSSAPQGPGGTDPS